MSKTKKESNDVSEAVKEIISKKESKEQVVDFCKTGSDIFDLIGGGGLPWGKIVNIVGDNSSGKTLVSSELIATAHRIYGDKLIWHYDDAEAGYSFDSKAIWGIDIVSDDDSCSETLEEFESNIDKMLDKLEPDQRLIYVLDSFDSLTTEEELDHYDKTLKAIEKGTKRPGTYGQSKSKGASQFFRVMRRKIKNKKCLLIIVSQVRENIGVMFGAKYARMGGKALDFYAAQIFWLAVAEKHGADTPYGIAIKIKNTKNKVWKPYRSGIIEILFDYGIDDISSNINFLYELKTDKGKYKEKYKTGKLKWDGKEYSHRGLIRHIEKNNLEAILSERVEEKWNEIEEKTNMAKDRKSKWGE